MSAPRELDSIIAAWLDEGPSVLPDATRRSIAVSNRTIHQARRPMWWPWRDTDVNSIFKLALAGAAVVAVAVGGMYFINRGPSGPGSASPTPAPTATPAPSAITPGITGWTTYTSPVYGITFSYPDDWEQYGAATRAWKAGDAYVADDNSYQDIFVNPDEKDGDTIGLFVWREKADSGSDIRSREGLTAWAEAHLCAREVPGCETASDVAEPMCAGRVACGPAVIIPWPDGIDAYVADPETGMVTLVALGRHDSFPATARYGGGVQLLKSILTTMNVWPPEPGQVPSP